jgi:hypothetical protein
MSAFSDGRNYPDLIECCHLVLDRCHEVDGSVAHFGAPDARRLAIADVQKHIAGLLFSFKAVMQGRTRAQVLTMFGGAGVPAADAQESTEDFWRFGLVTIAHFRVDALFQIILRARGDYKNKSTFTSMLKQLLAVCELKDRDRTECIFLAATYIRNSFHNNGIHRGPNLDIEIQDMRFKFETGRAINCAGFGHVLGVLFEVVGCLEEILLCPAFAKLAGPIPDDWMLDAEHLAIYRS